MIGLALLLAISNQADIVEQSAKVAAAAWQSRRLTLRKPGTVDLRYQMTQGGAGVRLSLIAHEDEAKFGGRRAHRQYAATDFGETGRLQVHLDQAGDYSLLIDNRLETKQTAVVKFKGTILYDVTPLEVRTLSWERRAVVIAASLTLFFGLCWITGRRLWRAMVERGVTGPPGGYA